MQVQQRVNVDLALKVSYLGEDDYKVAIVAVAPYANGTRTATITEEVKGPLDNLLAECAELLEMYGMPIAEKAMVAASEAQGVAQRRGEL